MSKIHNTNILGDMLFCVKGYKLYYAIKNNKTHNYVSLLSSVDSIRSFYVFLIISN